MEAISVGGLVSGLDTNSIIDGLSGVEQIKVDRIESKKKEVEDRQTSFNEVVSRIGTFATKAEALNDIENFNLYTATTNDDEHVVVSGGEDATPGQFEVEVFDLATTQKVASGAFASTVGALGIAGEFEITRSAVAVEEDPSKPTVAITMSATDTLKDLAAKINAAEGVGVSASILTLGPTDNRLVLTAIDDGSEGFFLKDTIGNPLGGSGLGLISDTQSLRTDFSLVKSAGGAASGTDELSLLTTGIGGSNLLTNGDAFRISGTKADGSAVAATDWSFDPAVDKVDNLLAQVSAAFGGSVSASLNSSGEIELVDLTSGLSEMTLKLELIDNDASGSTMSLGESEVMNNFSNVLGKGSKAFFKIDGLSVSTQGNKDDNIVQGTSFELKKAEAGKIIKVGLERDVAGIKGKIKAFVEEYNSLLKFIDQKMKVEISDDDDEEAAKVKSKGSLAGDSATRRIRAELQKMMTAEIEELDGHTQYSSLARVGITSSKTAGTLEIDEEDLEKAIKTDFDGVRRLFAASGYSSEPEWELGRFDKDTKTGTYAIDADGDLFDSDQSVAGTALEAGKRIGLTLTSNSGDSKGLSLKAESGSGSFTFIRGLASQLQQWNAQANDFVNGVFKNTRESISSQLKSYDERIFDMQERVENYRQSLVKQFADMEQSVSRLQSQQSAFMSQIGSL